MLCRCLKMPVPSVFFKHIGAYTSTAFNQVMVLACYFLKARAVPVYGITVQPPYHSQTLETLKSLIKH